MPQSFGVYGEQKKDVQPWSQTITLFPGSQNVSNFFSLYTSQGDVTLTGANTIPTLLDGPEKVVRYGNLTLGDGTTPTSLNASNRCKGLTIICDSLTVKANASLNMTARGARVLTNDDPFFPFVDFRIPSQITLVSNQVTPTKALSVIRDLGLALWDQGTWQALVSGIFGFNLGITQAGTVSLLQVAGCGAGGSPNSMGTGVIGVAGTNGGMGGGGTGGSNTIGGGSYYSARGGYGSPYSGGSGSGAAFANSGYEGYVMEGAPLQSKYSGPGGRGGFLWHTLSYWMDSALAGYGCGGAGNPGGLAASGAPSNPGGDGTGGRLTIVCRGSATVLAGGKIEANGVAGGSAANNSCGGGGSGGGTVIIIAPTCSNSGTVQAAGGAGGTGNYAAGGAGGAGSVVTKTFIEMGW
ncbi:MAG: hypothetical protein HY795_05815 [Desulfovibrio sp.]|nr:hypothetical protein [Desulfovibrio sp.]MBI4961349.1 hypothetical protein [Desulfovibrio sp.]